MSERKITQVNLKHVSNTAQDKNNIKQYRLTYQDQQDKFECLHQGLDPF